MDLLDRLLAHDVWTTTQFLRLCEALPDEDLDREFDIGHRSLRATFEHVVYNVEAWTDEWAGRPIRTRGGSSVRELLARLERAHDEFARMAKDVAARAAWDETWVDPHGMERTQGGTIAHLLTHSMHHRAQILYLMRLVGLENRPEGDLLGWESADHDDGRGRGGSRAC